MRFLSNRANIDDVFRVGNEENDCQLAVAVIIKDNSDHGRAFDDVLLHLQKKGGRDYLCHPSFIEEFPKCTFGLKLCR